MKLSDIEFQIQNNKSKKEIKKADGKEYVALNLKYNCRNSDVILVNHNIIQEYTPKIKNIKGVSKGITIFKEVSEEKTKIISLQILGLKGKLDSSTVKKVLMQHFEAMKGIKEHLDS